MEISSREKKLHKGPRFYRFQCQMFLSTKYRMWKLSDAIKRRKKEIESTLFFCNVCVCGAYNNVHKLSIHFIALSVNLVLLFHHLPHIYSPFAIHTDSHCCFNPFFHSFFLFMSLCLSFWIRIYAAGSLSIYILFFSLSCCLHQIWTEIRFPSFCIFAKIREYSAFVGKWWRCGVTRWWWKCKCADTIIPI